jgi:gliding motility-associated-like protein
MVTRIKQIALSILFLVALIPGLSFNASASHVAAADFYWDYIGTGQGNYHYRVTLTIYRACELNNATIPPNGTQPVCFTNDCVGGNIIRNLPEVGRDTMDQLCPNYAAINSCRVPTSIWPAFERVRFSDTITLPFACKWYAGWSLCCRNSGITNIAGAGGYELFIKSMINNTVKWSNSSPRFLIDPIPYLCQNQPAFFLNGPLDPNNDSLSVFGILPRDGSNCSDGTPINYGPTYSLANPIASTAANPYTVNTYTGTATFTPTLTGKFVLAFRCYENDRFTGDTLGYINRDVQVAVLSCISAPPTIDSMPINLSGGSWVPTPPTGGYILACPGIPLQFSITATSNTSNNNVYLSSTNQSVVPNSTFGVLGQGTGNPVGTFSWTPQPNDLGDYTIIFMAKDSTCNNNQPLILINYYVAFIKVLPGVDAGPDGHICAIGGDRWQFNVSGPPSAAYVWTNINGGPTYLQPSDSVSSPSAYPPYNTTYVVTAYNIISSCKNKDTVQVWIDTSNTVLATPHDAVLCRPGYFSFSALGQGLPPLANLQCGLNDTVQCQTPDTLEVASQAVGAGIVPSTQDITTMFPKFRTARIQFLITKKELYNYYVRAGTINGIALNMYLQPNPVTYAYNNLKISVKCTDRTELNYQTGAFEQNMTLVYTAPGPIIPTYAGASSTAPNPGGWTYFKFDRPYSRDSTKGLIVEICYSNPTPAAASGITSIVNTGVDQMGIQYSTTGTTGICNDPNLASTTYFRKARPDVKIDYCPSKPVPFPFTWSPGMFLSDSTSGTPLAYIAQTDTFTVTTVGRNGCKVTDQVRIYVPVHHYDIFPKDTTFCIGDKFMMHATGDFDKVQWYEGDNFAPATTLDCPTCKEPIGMPLTTTKYVAVMTDKDGCSDTMFLTAVVKDKPGVHVINNDTTIKYGTSIQLLVSGGYLYSWQPMSTLSNPNVANPWASPTEPTTYIVYGLASNGCRNVDSVRVNIDYRDNLFVPNAFSPNGDGKNDVFRVSNITFQKLQEFRVFNRWGQEIYSTTDPKKGWDGSWKGVPQDLGSYQYLIRVSYPDGYIESYKGDVTLLR